MCLEAMQTMYFDEKISMTQCIDILPNVLIDAIRMGNNAQDVGVNKAKNNDNRWTKDTLPEAMVFEDNEINTDN